MMSRIKHALVLVLLLLAFCGEHLVANRFYDTDRGGQTSVAGGRT